MADLSHISDLIKDAIAEADGDMRAAGRIQGVLLEGLGLNIAYAAGEDRTTASMLCDSAAIGIYEQATLSACVLADARRL